MNLTLWIATGLLALVALVGGTTKTFVATERLAAHSGGEWTGRAGIGLVRTLGIIELLAAAGLVLPAVLGVAPVMVPVTAACWILLMVGAMITHGRLHQYRFVALNVVYLALAAFVVWGRLDPAPSPAEPARDAVADRAARAVEHDPGFALATRPTTPRRVER